MLKVLILSASLTLAAAQDNKTDTTCTFNAPGTEVKQTCPWYTDCSESTNETLSGCLLKGNNVCNTYQYLGSSGLLVKNNLPMGCHPTATCCDGQCCTDLQSCVLQEGPPEAEFHYDFKMHNIGGIARNQWRTPELVALENRPRVCIDRIFAADSGSKAVFTPMIALFLILVVAASGFSRSDESAGILLKILYACVIVSGFFLIFSEGWEFSLLTTLVASAQIACPKKYKGYLVLGELAFLWIYFGGNMNFLWGLGTMTNFFTLSQTKDLAGIEASCAKFYDFYKYEAAEIRWDLAPSRTTFGLCEREFLGYLMIMSYVQALAIFAMVTLEFHNYLAPVSDKGFAGTTETTNPIAMAPASDGSDNA